MKIRINVLTKNSILIKNAVTMAAVLSVVVCVPALGTVHTIPPKLNISERTIPSGETIIVIKHLQDGKKIAMISGDGSMADNNRPTICAGYSYSITDVIIEDGVTHIGAGAFESCADMITIEIPSSVISIGSNAFRSCERLTSITIPNGIVSIENFTFFLSGLTSIIIPSSVISIGDGAFSGSSLNSIHIPHGVITIGREAFRSCRNLMSVTIPSSVTSIRNGAFMLCRNMVTIRVLNPVPPRVGDEAFQYINENACLYVLKESISAYRTAEGWKDVECIKPLEDAPRGEGN